MSVIIVGGPACAGKSTFIKKNFADKTIIDLKDFQDKYLFLTYDNVVKSYEDCKNALITAIKEGKDVVLEHTLLRAIRREVYINAIKEVTDEDIIIYFFKPSLPHLLERVKLRTGKDGIGSAQVSIETLEVPTFDEGYSQIYIIKDDTVVEQVNPETAIKRFIASAVIGNDELTSKIFEELLENETENIPENFIELSSKYVEILDKIKNKETLIKTINSWIKQ
jgi:predicted kinase